MRSVGHETPGEDEFAGRVYRWHCVAGRQLNHQVTLGQKEIFAGYHECAHPFADKGREGRLDLAGTTCIQNHKCALPRTCAAFCTIPLSVAVWGTLAGLMSTAIMVSGGIRLCISSRHFAINSTVRTVMPVMLPPGRARLVTRPTLTGSVPIKKTIGIVWVAALAASAPGVLPHYNDNGHLTANQIHSQCRQPIVVTLCPSVLDRYVAALGKSCIG